MKPQQTLGELASLIRSKNAGPFWLTFDILFDQPEVFRRVVDGNCLSPTMLAERYGFDPEVIQLVIIPAALAIKISLPRPRVQGDPGEADMYAGQQYALLVDLAIN